MQTVIIVEHDTKDALKSSPLWQPIMDLFLADGAVSVVEISGNVVHDEYTAACLAHSHDRQDDQDNG